MSQVPALAQVIRNLGFSWSVADEVCNAVEALNLQGARSDDLAAALFRWRSEACRASLGQARKRAERILAERDTPQAVAEAAAVCKVEGEVEGQLELFNTADERQRLMMMMAQMHGR